MAELILRALAEDLWVIDHPFKTLGACLGTRTSVIRLADGTLWLLAPGPGLVALKSGLEALGPVRALVAPNTMHHLFLPEAAAVFTGATVYGPAGLVAKQPELRFEAIATASWAAELPMLTLEGFGELEERAFLHSPTRTLLLTDLAFNIQHADHAWTRLFMRINDGYGKFGPTRLCRSLIKDKALMARTLGRLLDWDFDRIVVAHGEVLESGGKAALRTSFARIGIEAQAKEGLRAGG